MSAESRVIVLALGGLQVSSEAAVIKTLLGSCIGVCLYDPVRRIGGMNHFMLPCGGVHGPTEAPRFGVHAMDMLIAELMKRGAERGRLVAKVFGGAHVLGLARSPDSIPNQNIDFIRGYLERESIPVLAEDLGGCHPREIYFHTDSGRAFVRKVSSPRAWRRLLPLEKFEEARSPRYGDVTLFEQE